MNVSRQGWLPWQADVQVSVDIPILLGHDPSQMWPSDSYRNEERHGEVLSLVHPLDCLICNAIVEETCRIGHSADVHVGQIVWQHRAVLVVALVFAEGVVLRLLAP